MTTVTSERFELSSIWEMRLHFHNRQSTRLKGHDYSRPGAYFLTLCTENWEPISDLGRTCLFGKICAGKMQLNDAGLMIHNVWMELPNRFPSISLDTMVVMPNHLHGIIVLNPEEASKVGEAKRVVPTLGTIIGAFKSITTVRYIQGVKQKKWPEFYRRIWERNYHDHIIRHEQALNRIRRYIELNPLKWGWDRKNPFRQVGGALVAPPTRKFKTTQRNRPAARDSR